MELTFTDGFDQSVSLPSMNRQCTNCYPKFDQHGDVIEKRLFGTPGQSQLATTGSAATEINRGSNKMADVPFGVNGTNLYRLNSDLSVSSSLGAVDGTGKVSMANNGTQLMILVPGIDGYIWNEGTSTFLTITDSDFKANGLPQVVMFIDGYFMASTDTKKFIISELNDGLSWRALDFGTAESDPDVIVTLVNFKNEAYILGSETIEGDDNVPQGDDFPFIRNGLFLDKGAFAPFSVVKTTNTFMFIGGGKGEDPAIWSLQGNGLVSISNTGVELLLSALSSVEMAQVSAYSYRQDGSTFVAWELPGETILYDTDNGKWHKRKSQVVDGAGVTKTVGWRSTALLRAYGKLICFDTQDGRIGDISRDFFDEYGTEIQREFDINALRADKNVFAVPVLEVTIQAGVGDSATPNPKIRMKKSKNGSSFSGERVRSMGVLGDVDHRVVWRGNGRFKHLALFRILTSEKVRFVVIRVDAKIKVGRGTTQ